MRTCPTCGIEVPSIKELCWAGSCWGCHDDGLCASRTRRRGAE